jgi:hypothetical protein
MMETTIPVQTCLSDVIWPRICLSQGMQDIEVEDANKVAFVMDDQTGNQVIRADTGNLKRAYSYGRTASLREAQLAVL